MIDISQTCAPKSDQLNADDLIGGSLTIKVSKVSRASDEQPIAINFDGDGGKPYKPCKSMRRVLMKVWGADGLAYAGRRMTLYRDDDVVFGGMKVGGIRISHMSGIEAPVTMALTATRAQRKPYTVKPLAEERASPRQADQQQAPRRSLFDVALEKARDGQAVYDAWTARLKPEQIEKLADIQDQINNLLDEADERGGIAVDSQADAGFPGDDALAAASARENAA